MDETKNADLKGWWYNAGLPVTDLCTTEQDMDLPHTIVLDSKGLRKADTHQNDLSETMTYFKLTEG